MPRRGWWIGLAGVVLVLLAPAVPAAAHCDGLDGPVVKAARAALAKGDVTPVLVWVQAEHEAELRRAFAATRAVRALGPEAEALADRSFFETLVRLHRAGEGAPYTGLKPAGQDLGPAIPLADRAVEGGDVEPLVGLLTDELRRGLLARFEEVRRSRSFAHDDVRAGREHVRAYVAFVHYVERAHEAAARAPEGHFPAESARSHQE